MECTGFFSDDIGDVKCGYHIHLNDIIKNQGMLQNEKILLFHFSQKYKTIDSIAQYIYILDEPLNYFFNIFIILLWILLIITI
jgi:hypothetical protein